MSIDVRNLGRAIGQYLTTVYNNSRPGGPKTKYVTLLERSQAALAIQAQTIEQQGEAIDRRDEVIAQLRRDRLQLTARIIDGGVVSETEHRVNESHRVYLADANGRLHRQLADKVDEIRDLRLRLDSAHEQGERRERFLLQQVESLRQAALDRVRFEQGPCISFSDPIEGLNALRKTPRSGPQRAKLIRELVEIINDEAEDLRTGSAGGVEVRFHNFVKPTQDTSRPRTGIGVEIKVEL